MTPQWSCFAGIVFVWVLTAISRSCILICVLQNTYKTTCFRDYCLTLCITVFHFLTICEIVQVMCKCSFKMRLNDHQIKCKLFLILRSYVSFHQHAGRSTNSKPSMSSPTWAQQSWTASPSKTSSTDRIGKAATRCTRESLFGGGGGGGGGGGIIQAIHRQIAIMFQVCWLMKT